MTTLKFKERIKVSLLWTALCVLCINAFDDRCADYLLSGWNRLDDSKILEWNGNPIYQLASNFRLYGANRWETNQIRDVHTFLILFTSPKTVKAFISISHVQVTIVLSFINSNAGWLMVDGGDGTFYHTSTGLEPQFHYFSELTKVTHFAIHFYQTVAPSLQFDILGCDMVEEDPFEGEDLQSFEFVPLAVEDLPPGTVLGENVLTHMDCGHLCFDLMSCVAFSTDKESGRCIGYNTNVYGNFPQGEIRQQSLRERRSYYFYNYGLTRTLDYCRNASVILMYRVYTVRKTRMEAARFCERFSANLLLISSIPQMTSVQEKINSSTVLSHEGPYFIGGNYSVGGWQYTMNNESAAIPNQLWSSSPDNTTGHCVVLANDGIRSYECDKKLFFICAI